jgi:segregation and condensation protein B
MARDRDGAGDEGEAHKKGAGRGRPPRLTVVETNVSHSRGEQAVSVEMAQSSSPVHDLISTIEESATAVAAVPREVPKPHPERLEKLRILEAVMFAAAEPQDELRLATYLKPGDDVSSLLMELADTFAGRGVNLVKVAGKWTFRTAEDLSWVLERHSKQERRLSRAALETLAIVAYHQPVTRAEIEEIRGVTISKGTLDVLMEAVWVRPRGRRRAPGKPITYGTTERFLEHFGLEAVKDLPGLADLKAAGLLDANLPPDFKVPEPKDAAALMPDELPLEDAEEGDEPLQSELELDEPIEDEEEDDPGGQVFSDDEVAGEAPDVPSPSPSPAPARGEGGGDN